MAEEKKGGYKEQFGSFADKLKSSKTNTPIQEVVRMAPPEKVEKEKVEESQLNVWVPKELLKKMKRHGLDADLSLKEITIAALSQYLKQ